MTFQKYDTGSTIATFEFNYHARGFCCSNCSTGLSLDRKECPHCESKLKNPYKERFKDEVSKENN